jgi:putative phosphoribosyl transferase
MPEFAVGAISEGDVVHVSGRALGELRLAAFQVLAAAEHERVELERSVRLFRGRRPQQDLSGRTVIIVDDGIATGCTALAAVKAARQLGAARVVLASPVVAPEARASLEGEVDDLVFLESPEGFFAVGAWYRLFPQTTDEEVVACLENARTEGDPPARGAAELACPEEGQVSIHSEGLEFAGSLAVPPGAKGVVVFSHGSASSRRNPRDRYLARLLRERGFATLLLDIEAPEDADAGVVLERQARRLVAAGRWLGRRADTGYLKAGLLGSSSGAAPALAAAALEPDLFAAVVCRGGRPDLAGERVLRRVWTPTLLVVGSRDEDVLRLNEGALDVLPGRRSLAVIPGGGHAFTEPGALEAVARFGARWFEEAFSAGKREACP